MAVAKAFSLNNWIDEHRHLLKPPVGNIQVYKDVQDFIVMVVGGPNSRKDFHYNETEELFYQLEGTITVEIMDEGKRVPIEIKEGEMFLLPARVPHSPHRPAGTIGLVIEKVRADEMNDKFQWYCENCDQKLYEKTLSVADIVGQLPPVMNAFYASEENRTCKHCGTVMEPPKALK